MTFSYDEHLVGDEGLNRIRLEIGDTDSTRQLLRDEEIVQVISEEDTFNLRVSACCRLICAVFAGEPERYRIGDFTETQEEIYNRYRKMAKVYDAKGGGAPWAGSISVTFKDTTEADTSLEKPFFSRGMHNNP